MISARLGDEQATRNCRPYYPTTTVHRARAHLYAHLLVLQPFVAGDRDGDEPGDEDELISARLGGGRSSGRRSARLSAARRTATRRRRRRRRRR